MKENLISVIIPVYNVDQYLRRCLDSIINNSYRNLEIICVNDGSTDQSLAILKEYKEKDNRILLIDKPNGGVSSARNAGLKVAKGKYIGFVDSDDWVHELYFEYLHKAITEQNGDISICDYIRTDKNNALKKEVSYSIREMSLYEMYSNHDTKAFVWKCLFKADLLKNIFFDEKLNVEDCFYNYEVLIKNEINTIIYVNVVLYAYFIREGSLVTGLNHYDFLQLAKKYSYLCDNEERSNVRSIIAEEAIKKALSARYSYLLEKDTVHVKECNKIIAKLLKTSIQKQKIYKLMYYIPEIYRNYRINNDKSLLIYEKNVKLRMKNQRKWQNF